MPRNVSRCMPILDIYVDFYWAEAGEPWSQIVTVGQAALHFGRSGAGPSQPIDLRYTSSVHRPLSVYWITTFSEASGPNIAPFVTFSGLNHVPPRQTLAISPTRKPYENIMETGALVANIPFATADTIDRLWDSAWGGFRRGEDKFALLGIDTEPAMVVRPPRVRGAPACIEYTVIEVRPPTEDIGTDRPVLIIEPVAASVDPAFFDLSAATYLPGAPIPLQFKGNLFMWGGRQFIARPELRRQRRVLNGCAYFDYIMGKSSEHVSPRLRCVIEAHRAEPLR